MTDEILCLMDERRKMKNDEERHNGFQKPIRHNLRIF